MPVAGAAHPQPSAGGVTRRPDPRLLQVRPGSEEPAADASACPPAITGSDDAVEWVGWPAGWRLAGKGDAVQQTVRGWPSTRSSACRDVGGQARVSDFPSLITMVSVSAITALIARALEFQSSLIAVSTRAAVA